VHAHAVFKTFQVKAIVFTVGTQFVNNITYVLFTLHCNNVAIHVHVNGKRYEYTQDYRSAYWGYASFVKFETYIALQEVPSGATDCETRCVPFSHAVGIVKSRTALLCAFVTIGIYVTPGTFKRYLLVRVYYVSP